MEIVGRAVAELWFGLAMRVRGRSDQSGLAGDVGDDQAGGHGAAGGVPEPRLELIQARNLS